MCTFSHDDWRNGHLLQALRGPATEARSREAWKQVQHQISLIVRRFPVSDEAEDLVQEGLLRVFRHIHELKDPVALQSWVMTVARNVARDFLKSGWHKGKEAGDPETNEDPRAGENSDEELDSIMELASRAIPRLCYEIFSLRLKGYELEEIAAVLGKSLGSIQGHSKRCKKRLGDWLERHLRR